MYIICILYIYIYIVVVYFLQTIGNLNVTNLGSDLLNLAINNLCAKKRNGISFSRKCVGN